MEKGVVFDIKRFAVNDGPGIRTAVFLKGCPLRCQWCHNPEGLCKEIEQSTKTVKVDGVDYAMPYSIGYEITADELTKELLKDCIFMEESGGGVTFSGGEPMLQHEFLQQVLEKLHQRGIHTAVDTSGLTPWTNIESIIPFTSLFLYDLKCIDEERHRQFTGVSNDIILDNLRKLSERGVPVQIRIPVIPTFNYNDEEMSSILSFVAQLRNVVRVDLLPYHTIAQSKYERLGISNSLFEHKSLKNEELQSYFTLFQEQGVKVSIGG
ncbi:glycyl-radical enzyme activating protein [uncultured Acetobacteroides sp.]|uniref:glycyl-radical enzyme activating protein n=1 Tax=uncultured Acetobacteroides sp. TaxID=1760811 RepID=UPI0029F45CDB|nr:glycyl-radical enzyme activating protein [uncultured Acetobacteroides sp.]